MSVSPIALGAAAGGVLLLWSAINNTPLLTAVGDVIKGKAPVPGASGAEGTSVALAQAGTIGNLGQAIATGVSESQGTPAVNKALGLTMAAAYGWAGSGEWPYLESGWQEESGWNQYAANVPSDPYNHAYGIPQANPGSKMASAGSNWESSAATQIKWGLGYIKATYGAPSKVPGWTPDGPEAGYVGY